MPSSGIHTAASPARGSMPSAGSPDPLVGTALAGYRLLERVGAGGMGSVYRAEQLSLHREVALKVLSEKLVSDSAFVDQFVNEARAAGQLNHPNVVQVYDVGQADSRHFFSMEFIHGGSLESKIPRTGGGVPWNEALNWFLDAANALIFAEKKGILHRDIKPDNFMLGQDGSVKLCDLGLAKKSESADLLAQGIIGTPHFISPESIRRKTEVDGRADLYSLGCTFFRIFTGRNPYPAPSVKDILLAHLNAPVPRVSSVVADFPKDLDEVVFRLMQKDPAQRFQTAEDLWEALDKIRLQYGMEAHGLHPGRAKKFAIAGAVIAVAAVGTLIALKPWVKPPPEHTKEIIERTTGVDPEEFRASKAESAFDKVTSDMFRELGRLEEGDNWKKDGWEGYVTRYEGVAQEYAGTAAAGKATTEAKRIREYRTAQEGKSDALAA
ncbi:MAG TPA: serine/threonine-protein kinase, partial [Planctomycetota bacterium]|nr:serine/threonine-protein kinase [Planctomycetota bacterium]